MANRKISQYTVLIVDDVPLNQLLVEKMLTSFNFNVKTAGNGLEAMREVVTQKPDLILLDIMMPIMDGFQVLEQLRQNPAWADIKVVVLSALNSNEDIVKAYNLGANDFISKPIVLNKLVNTVATHLGLPITE